MEDQTLRRSN